jgi:hypothetical protein
LEGTISSAKVAKNLAEICEDYNRAKELRDEPSIPSPPPKETAFIAKTVFKF